MDELVRWFGEQLDEDERIARVAATLAVPTLGAMNWRSVEGPSDAGGTYWCITTTPPNDTAPVVELVGSGMSGGGVHEEAVARHIAAHDPARVLREIDAKRAVLALHTQSIRDDGCQVCDVPGGRRLRPDACTTVRLLAVVYADRPGYRETWRP
ncbi:DUF6221 family protein [Streptomyces sp. NPDC020490]|uniref:DUF6221 family protein n=1 Tax=Streptomyces sp. NPDC020490 TaxID=3365078 RepID=UPI00378F089B